MIAQSYCKNNYNYFGQKECAFIHCTVHLHMITHPHLHMITPTSSHDHTPTSSHDHTPTSSTPPHPQKMFFHQVVTLNTHTPPHSTENVLSSSCNIEYPSIHVLSDSSTHIASNHHFCFYEDKTTFKQTSLSYTKMKEKLVPMEPNDGTMTPWTPQHGYFNNLLLSLLLINSHSLCKKCPSPESPHFVSRFSCT